MVGAVRDTIGFAVGGFEGRVLILHCRCWKRDFLCLCLLDWENGRQSDGKEEKGKGKMEQGGGGEEESEFFILQRVDCLKLTSLSPRNYRNAKGWLY